MSQKHNSLLSARLEISSQREIVALRRHVRDLCRANAMGLAAKSRVIMCVTELAENVLKHAAQGWCEIELLDQGDRRVMEIQVVDQGSGVSYLPHVLEERLDSDSNPLGTGLAGVRRIADQFEINSDAKGTAVTLRFMLPQKQRVQ